MANIPIPDDASDEQAQAIMDANNDQNLAWMAEYVGILMMNDDFSDAFNAKVGELMESGNLAHQLLGLLANNAAQLSVAGFHRRLCEDRGEKNPE